MESLPEKYITIPEGYGNTINKGKYEIEERCEKKHYSGFQKIGDERVYYSNNPLQSDYFYSVIKEPSYALHLTDVKWQIEDEKSNPINARIKLRYALNTNSIVCAVAFSKPKAKLLSFSNGRTLFVMNASDGSLVSACHLPHYFKQTEMHTRVLCFTNDGKYILLNGSGFKVLVFSIDANIIIKSLEGHNDTISALTVSSDSKTLVSGGFDGNICFWSLESFTLIKKIENPNDSKKNSIVSLSLGSNDSILYVSYSSGNIGIFDVNILKQINTFTAHSEPLLYSSISNNFSKIATASRDCLLKIWDINDFSSCKKTLVGHSNYVVSCCFSNDDKFLFSGSKDESIRIWSIETGKLLWVLKAHQNTIFKIDHDHFEKTFVSCGGDGLVCVWDYEVPE